MEFDFSEWLNIILRWVHVFAGIMWVGQTYFFTWLDRQFSKMTHDSQSDPNLWMVHSGGFYVVEKQTVPAMISKKLHWFKWEAFVTWLSGISLLGLVYYAGGLLADATFDQTKSILFGVGIILVAWFVYDILWNSALASNERLGVVISFVFAALATYAFSMLFGGRTAYIHMGAMFGTIMTANVWVRILPAQRTMVASLQKGEKPDLALAARAKMRSKHNTFLVVPVVFTMISNHYPTVSYGTEYSWILLSVLVLLGWTAAWFLRRA